MIFGIRSWGGQSLVKHVIPISTLICDLRDMPLLSSRQHPSFPGILRAPKPSLMIRRLDIHDAGFRNCSRSRPIRSRVHFLSASSRGKRATPIFLRQVLMRLASAGLSLAQGACPRRCRKFKNEEPRPGDHPWRGS